MNLIVERLMEDGMSKAEAKAELIIMRTMAKTDLIEIAEVLMDNGIPPTEEFIYSLLDY